jgi:hypothetical protein
MRTTLNIEAEAVAQLKKYAEERDISLGQAASDLIQLGVQSIPVFKFKKRNGFALLELPPGTPPLTEELLAKWEEEEYEEEFKRAMSPRR